MLGALASGALLSIVFPAWSWTFLCPVVLVPGLWLLRSVRSVPGGIAIGLLFGIGFVVPTFLWFFTTLVAEFELGRRVALPLSALLALALAWPFAVWGGLCVALRRGPLPGWLTPVLAWGAMEWLRGVGPGALPWLRLGDALHASPLWLQGAAFLGVAGVSAGLVLVNGLVLTSALERSWRPLAVAAAILTAVGLSGAWRLAAPIVEGDPVRVALVQAATPQTDRFEPATRRSNLDRHLQLSGDALAAGARLVVWSETALDYPPEEGPDIGPLWASEAPTPSQVLLVGGVLEAPGGGHANGALAVAGDGTRLGSYAKRRLVPLVERAHGWPAEDSRLRRRLKRFLAQSGYLPGDSPAPISAAGLQLGVLICFETLFDEDVRATVEAGADVLVNLSNDAFFPDRGATQHALHSILRSIEVGRPLLRVSNLGIGLVVDARGRVALQVPRDERGTRVAEIRPVREATLYSRGGHLFDELLVLLAVAGCALRRRTGEATA